MAHEELPVTGAQAPKEVGPPPADGDDEPSEAEAESAIAAETDPAAAERKRADIRDRRLIRRLRQGDEHAFEEIVGLYQNRIYGLMLRMIGNPEEAEDLAQEVFITVHRAIGTYRGEGRFYTWLYRIATNTCKNRIKYLRGRNFHRSVPVDETPEAHGSAAEGGPVASLQSQVAGPEAMTEGNRLQAAIQRELALLDDEHRLLIVLRDVQGMSYQDILKITGLQEGTLKSRLHRARIALKDRLRDYLK